ncbi:pleckstrin homology domain-containing family A member 1-like [Clytia hemisphaerica]|uniref:PH domain-containing protein n=1 Tax=Clytia hemisphaerica TaxID=252671 RepID=A0A7M5WSR7_9CNID|eukprot:TCONS_00021927-protein
MAEEKQKERKQSIELLYYQQARKSMSEQERLQFVLKENGNCEGFLEFQVQSIFKKYFFVLDLLERSFSYYNVNPKRSNASQCTLDSISVSDITKVTAKPNLKEFAFEVSTHSNKYFLAAKDERDMKIWIQALKKAATSPYHAQKNTESNPLKSSSCEQLNKVNEAHSTSIIGGCVITTPVSQQIDKKRNNSNTVARSALRIIREGYCWKQGAVMKNWKRRYFRLNAVSLAYYETHNEQNYIKSISTNDIRKVKIMERFCNRINVIEVDTPGRKFYMHPENIEEVQVWRTALEDIAQSNSVYLPRTKSV